MPDPGYSLQTFGVDAAMLYLGSVKWGQTRGGVTFDPGATLRDPEFDGVPPFVEDQSRITSWNARFTGRFGIFTPSFALKLHAGGASDGSASNNAITPIDARTFIGDTMADFRCVWRLSDNSYAAVVARRIRIHPWTIAGEDNSETLIDATIQCLCDPADLVQPPYRVLNPFTHASYVYTDYFSA